MKFVKNNKPFDCNEWTFVSRDLCDYNNYFVPIKNKDDRTFLDFGYFGYDTLNAPHKVLDIDFLNDLYKVAKYVCPFNKFEHTSIIPLGVLTNDPMSYITKHNGKHTPWYAEMACDIWEPIENYNNIGNHLTGIQHLFLGHGYTDSCYPSDGHASKESVGINLENGDTVLFAILYWYNK